MLEWHHSASEVSLFWCPLFHPSGVGALLTELYTDINEPDSLYALAGRPGAAAQLRLTSHEHNWPASLQGYDLALQQSTAVLFTHQPTMHTAQQHMHREHMQPAQCMYGIVNALQQLGCSHTALQYIQGCSTWGSGGRRSVPGQRTEPAPEIREMQSELAWRLGQWDDSGELSSAQDTLTQQKQEQGFPFQSHSSTQIIGRRGSGGGNWVPLAPIETPGVRVGSGDETTSGFHATIFAVLQALRSGDANVVENLLQRATMDTVCSLTSGGSESVGEFQRARTQRQTHT